MKDGDVFAGWQLHRDGPVQERNFEYVEAQALGAKGERSASSAEEVALRLAKVFPTISRVSMGSAPMGSAPDTLDGHGQTSSVAKLTQVSPPDRHPAHQPGMGVEPPAAAWADAEFAIDEQKDEQRLIEEVRIRNESREDGRREAEQNLKSLLDNERERMARQLAAMVDSFAAEQANYFDRLEHEVVSLSLAIAARVLRREAAADPMLLTGSVRVALGQLADSTSVRLYVPSGEQSMWVETLALIPGLKLQPQVIADTKMGTGECRMTSELGGADLGILNQLKEIERSFFDHVGSGSGMRPRLHPERRDSGEDESATKSLSKPGFPGEVIEASASTFRKGEGVR